MNNDKESSSEICVMVRNLTQLKEINDLFINDGRECNIYDNYSEFLEDEIKKNNPMYLFFEFRQYHMNDNHYSYILHRDDDKYIKLNSKTKINTDNKIFDGVYYRIFDYSKEKLTVDRILKEKKITYIDYNQNRKLLYESINKDINMIIFEPINDNDFIKSQEFAFDNGYKWINGTTNIISNSNDEIQHLVFNIKNKCVSYISQNDYNDYNSIEDALLSWGTIKSINDFEIVTNIDRLYYKIKDRHKIEYNRSRKLLYENKITTKFSDFTNKTIIFTKTFERFKHDLSSNITEIINNYVKGIMEDEKLTLSDVIKLGYCADIATIIWGILGDEVEILSENIFMFNYIIDSSFNGDIIPNSRYGLFYLDKNGQPLTIKYGSRPHIEWRKIISLPIHTWIYYNGKHYDIQNPNGVSNFFDMDYFKLPPSGIFTGSTHLDKSISIDEITKNIKYDNK